MRSMEDKTSTMSSISLPNDVIGHIISFLPTKYAVGTSVLSKSLTKLWYSSITSLDFDDKLFINPPSHHHYNNNNNNDDYVKNYSFVEFVNRVLLLVGGLHEPKNLNKFRLVCASHYNCKLIRQWVTAALSLGVKEIDLSFSAWNRRVYKSSVLLPALFASRTLVVLKLRSCSWVSSSFTCLQSLKTLHLDSVIFYNDESSHRLFSACCPILEDLSMLGCLWCTPANALNISSPSLKYLCIETRYASYRPRIVLDTPNLTSFILHGWLSKGYTMTNVLQSLVKADFRLLHDRHLVPNTTKSLVELFGGISNICELSLSSCTLWLLQHRPCELPTFHKLSYLNLEPDFVVEWKLVKDFLRSSPQLSCVAFYHEPYYYVGGKARWLRQLGFLARFQFRYFILNARLLLPETEA